MNLLFWGITLGAAGKVLLVVAILKAHGSIADEHRIDKRVLKTFRLEKYLTILGLILIILGYLIEMYFYGFTPLHIHDCSDGDCAAAINAAPRALVWMGSSTCLMVRSSTSA